MKYDTKRTLPANRAPLTGLDQAAKPDTHLTRRGRRARAAVIGSAVLGAGALVAGVTHNSAEKPPTPMVNATFIFHDADGSGYYAAADKLVGQFEDEGYSRDDIIDQLKAQRSVDVAANPNGPQDVDIVYPNEHITIQVPETTATEAAISDPTLGTGELVDIQFSPVAPAE